jgi:L,D-transpeptidase ErfK/SrfK
VVIVNQPYLIGQRDGVLYLEAHTPLENPNACAVEQEKVNEKLRKLEKKSGRPLDWKKVQQVQAEARGVPVPIFDMEPGRAIDPVTPLEVGHPDKLYGSPEPPELKPGAWHVLAAETSEEIDARRLAAIINHQGPQIPARVLPKSSGYRVVAGPFNDAGEAREAARRLKIDLEIDGMVIEPAREIAIQH